MRYSETCGILREKHTLSRTALKFQPRGRRLVQPTQNNLEKPIMGSRADPHFPWFGRFFGATPPPSPQADPGGGSTIDALRYIRYGFTLRPTRVSYIRRGCQHASGYNYVAETLQNHKASRRYRGPGLAGPCAPKLRAEPCAPLVRPRPSQPCAPTMKPNPPAQAQHVLQTVICDRVKFKRGK